MLDQTNPENSSQGGHGEDRYESFSNFASGIQSIFLTMALVVGGIWTWFTYGTLQQRAKAEAELAEINKRIAEEAAIEVRLTASQISLPKNCGRFISVTVELKNIGSRSCKVGLEKPLSARRVTIDDDGSIIAEKKFTAQATSAGVVLRSNMAVRTPFVVKVDEPGLYLLAFQGTVSPEELNTVKEDLKAVKDEIPPDAEVAWSESQFFVVR